MSNDPKTVLADVDGQIKAEIDAMIGRVRAAGAEEARALDAEFAAEYGRSASAQKEASHKTARKRLLAKAREKALRAELEVTATHTTLHEFFARRPSERNLFAMRLREECELRETVVRNAMGAIMNTKREATDRDVYVQGGDIHKIVDRCEEALLDSKAEIFRRGPRLVSIRRIEERKDSNGLTLSPGQLIAHALTVPNLIEEFTSRLRFFQDNGRGVPVPVNCPVDVANTYLKRIGLWKVPELVGIIQVPTLRRDGSLIDVPGYDEQTGLYYHPGGLMFPEIPAAPTREEALAALAELKKIFQEFPYADKKGELSPSLSVALSGVLTVVGRGAFAFAPLHGAGAARGREGKGRHSDIPALIATGTHPLFMVETQSPEELRKRILAVLDSAVPVVVIDNAEHPVGGAALCIAITQPNFSDRVLGASKQRSAPTGGTTFFVNGNGLQLLGDVSVRSITVSLDSGQEDPEARSFNQPDLDGYVLKNRPRLVAAALTVLRAYIHAGKPPVPGLKPWGGFEEWNALVPAALMWLGEANPCDTREKVKESDPAGEILRTVLELWWTFWGSELHVGRDYISVVHRSEFDGALPPQCYGTNGLPDVNKFGHFLKKYAGRIEDGLRFVKTGEEDQFHRALWKVEDVSGEREEPVSKRVVPAMVL